MTFNVGEVIALPLSGFKSPSAVFGMRHDDTLVLGVIVTEVDEDGDCQVAPLAGVRNRVGRVSMEDNSDSRWANSQSFQKLPTASEIARQ